jgi:intracellular sulfur oxidation DsrE/DsrF family protein
MKWASRSFKVFLLCVCVSMPTLPTTLWAEATINDAAALKDLKEAKGVFLLNLNTPRKAALFMETIQGTHAGLVRQGVKPDLVMVFIGPTVQYLTTKPSGDLEFEFSDELKSIANSAAELHKLGVRMEVCGVAARAFGVDTDTILPGMEVVGDGFISLIGWQSQGYKLVPIF